MNYEKYQQEEKDFSRYWNHYDAVGEREWKLIEDSFTDTFFLVDPEELEYDLLSDFLFCFPNWEVFFHRYRRRKDTIVRKGRKSWKVYKKKELAERFKNKKEVSRRMKRLSQQLLRDEEDQVIADTDFGQEMNRRIENELLESIPIPPGSIVEFCGNQYSDSILCWEKKNTEYGPFPFRNITDDNGKYEKIKNFSKILLRSLRDRLPNSFFDFAPEGVIIQLYPWARFGLKVFIPYEKLRETTKELYNLRETYFSWFSSIRSSPKKYHQSYLLVSKEAKMYIAPYDEKTS